MTSHKEKYKWKIVLEIGKHSMVNDAIHERINKGREDSHANILS